MQGNTLTEQADSRSPVRGGRQMVRVRTLTSVSEVEELRPYWTQWQSHPNADIDFFLMICNVRPDVIRPHVLVVYRRDVPHALLVGRLENTTVDAAIGYSRWASCRTRRLAFIQEGFLGSSNPAESQFLVREVVRSLKNDIATYALFSHVRTDSSLYQAARRAPGFWSRYHFFQLQAQAHRSMTVPGSIDDLYRRLPSKKRKNLRWQAKKLLTQFPNAVQVRSFRSVSELEVMFRDVEQVACKSYQRGLGVGFTDNEEMRRRMLLSAESNWLRAHVLYIAGTPCAFWIGTLYRGVFHSNSMGYDRAFAKYSPGMFLIMKVIEESCGVGGGHQIRQIDWGLGDAQYKEMLSDQEWKDGSVSIFAPTWRGAWLNLALTAPALADSLAKSVLKHIGLLQKVKTMWRRNIASKQLKRGDPPRRSGEKPPGRDENMREV